jgi:hypothetical protein
VISNWRRFDQNRDRIVEQNKDAFDEVVFVNCELLVIGYDYDYDVKASKSVQK